MYANTILVVGPVSTEIQRDDLTAFAFDVTNQLGHPAIIATSTDVDVRDFAAVVVYGPALSSSLAVVDTAMVLEAEAVLHDVPVIVPQPLSCAAACDACEQYQTLVTVRSAHGEPFCATCWGNTPGCYQCLATNEPTEPVFVDGGWVPQCKGCARITRALHPSDWNLIDNVEDLPCTFGVAA
ncbi:hypothetical protein OG887_06245 [Streptomyces sp. NBC_00053]|uniref:hypothetical protein n=1 Tax=unclassified Streptomyces TaxID=2593676 RepID=UPI00225503D5|nr:MULTISPECIES: hypothetical protein [unclassified Streptomyces]MCX5498993.1 hypothetical protein [Streptomyces sp. NBC_00052]MCX5552475.1 hypothetical protein [Streptomyces sp. NBC_00051]